MSIWGLPSWTDTGLANCICFLPARCVWARERQCSPQGTREHPTTLLASNAEALADAVQHSYFNTSELMMICLIILICRGSMFLIQGNSLFQALGITGPKAASSVAKGTQKSDVANITSSHLWLPNRNNQVPIYSWAASGKTFPWLQSWTYAVVWTGASRSIARHLNQSASILIFHVKINAEIPVCSRE